MNESVRSLIRAIYSWVPMKIYLFRLLRMVYVPPFSVYQHLHFSGDISVYINNKSIDISCHGYQDENCLFWAGFFGWREGTSTTLWTLFVKDEMVILDIGANTGIFALSAKLLAPNATVYAFEPVSRIAAKLSHNIDLNKFDIMVQKTAVSCRTGKSRIYDSGFEHEYSASLNKEMFIDVEREGFEVRTVRIDDFMRTEGLERIDLVKLDVEMHEPEALDGFGDIIGLSRPTFIIEILTENVGEAVSPFFQDKDYAFFEIRENREIQRVERLGIHRGNYLLCPEEKLGIIGEHQIIPHSRLVEMAGKR